MDISGIRNTISEGRTSLGIEFGSTRIKAVLIGRDHSPLASGSHSWENRLENGIWTYGLDDIWNGLQDCYRSLAADVKEKYGVDLRKIGSIGISAMMHGYLVFDKNDKLLVPFRTWRNTTTEEAAKKLTELFRFNIPLRWSIAHLYQAILNDEPHVGEISFLTTLAGYVHWRLTGRKVIGTGDGSGIVPIDGGTLKYDASMASLFDELISDRGYPWKLADILPEILTAGEHAGSLTEEGARLLDPTGLLQPGIPFCPPEGDADTGMVATNSIAPRTGNISAGTSVFTMIVLEKELSKVYTEVDMVATPAGRLVAMVHSNTCTSDLDAWVGLFGEVIGAVGGKADKSELYTALYKSALEADDDCGGLLSYNFLAGEPVIGLDEGRPLFARMPDSRLTLPNFMRAQLFSAIGTLRLGMDSLLKKEHIEIDKLTGHGGFFKTKDVGQRIMASALGIPVSVMETAGEGGAWGMAILASYMLEKNRDESLEDYLENRVFAGDQGTVAEPDPKLAASFEDFIRRYEKGLAIVRAAAEAMR